MESSRAGWRRLLLPFLLTAPSLGLPADQPRHIALTSAEYAPYYSESLHNHGPVAEIIKEAFARSDYTVSITFYPWPRAELYARQGETYDGMFPPWRSSEREDVFLFSDPLFPNVIGFYKRKDDSIAFETLDDFHPYTVGIVRGYANPEDFEEASISRVRARNDTQNLIMLCHKRTDLALIDRVMAEYLLATEYPRCVGEVEWMEPALAINPQHLVISKNTPNAEAKMDAFNRGYERLKGEGAVRRILRKHGILEAVEDATDTLYP